MFGDVITWYLGSKQKPVCPSFTKGLWVSLGAGCSPVLLSFRAEVKTVRLLHICHDNKQTTLILDVLLVLTSLLLFCFSSDSSWPSGRLWLRVGWIHTTLLSHEGGPTGGSLSSCSSENSSSASSEGGERHGAQRKPAAVAVARWISTEHRVTVCVTKWFIHSTGHLG